MPQLDRSVIRERAARLRKAGDAALARHLTAERGARRRILVERNGLGRTEHFTIAEIGGGRPGEIVEATITGSTNRALIAEAA
jgi:threonylcarbamoyladenosine tRNA methylthiotransferase MtaB